MTWEFIKFKPSNYEFIKDCLQTAVLGKKKNPYQFKSNTFFKIVD